MPSTTILRHVASTLGSRDDVAPSVFNHPPPPVLLGGLVALFLSGAVFMQVLVYFQVYRHDVWKVKSVVLAVWVLDIVHSALIITANWDNLVIDYGAYDTLDHISWSISLTIALTAFTTAIVHCFFIRRIYKLSRGNLVITVPLVLLAFLRVASALVTTAEMLRLRSYVLFIQQYTYIFTMGLTISAALDVLITGVLCFYLRRGRDGFARVNHMIDLLTLYTVETGMLTCIATSLSLFFWLFMRHNFAFLGMHLAINKLYANSILASLNARKSIAVKVSTSDRYPMPVILPHHAPLGISARHFADQMGSTTSKPLQVTIDVERTIQHDTILANDSRPASFVDGDSQHRSGGDDVPRQ